ncbi:hypothetical protein DFS34DRAFT_516341 [Phlyctochytrium arcticum]|nr:hypothetical protein DFS34DRAFT_516341 [Phlyctochytrium arcticum]
MPPKRKRQDANHAVWFNTIPGKKGNKEYYKPGCANCGIKTISKFYHIRRPEVDRLQLLGLSFQLGEGASDIWLCEPCRSCWRKVGFFQDTSVTHASPPPAPPQQGDSIFMITDFDNAENIEAMTINMPLQTTPPEGSASLADYRKALQGLCARPFAANPFIQMDEFVEQYPELYELKASVFCLSAAHSVVYNDRQKRAIIFSICYDAAIMDKKVTYIKRYLGENLRDISYSDQRHLSRLGICFHPSKSIGRANDHFARHREQLIRDINAHNPLLVVTIDDFHWTHIRALPATGNAPGKFTTAHTTANYAVKIHPSLSPLPPSFGKTAFDVIHGDLGWVSEVVVSPTETYAEVRNGKVLSERMYAYSIATKAGSQKDFHVIGSDDNSLKTPEDLRPILGNIFAFLAKVAYPRTDGVFDKSFVLCGDFYVWMYANKMLNSPRFAALKPHILCVPDLMHTSLNAQEAVINHSCLVHHPSSLDCGLSRSGEYHSH